MTRSVVLIRDLLRLSTASKKKIDDLKYAEYLFRRHSWKVEKFTDEITKDRLRLSSYCLSTDRQSFKKYNKYRLCVSRSYYAIYHCARAVVYYVHGGDDYQEHNVLHKNLPNDFPVRATWDNDIRNARLARNEADYDPYPLSDATFKGKATANLAKAELFLDVSTIYLKIKGLQI